MRKKEKDTALPPKKPNLFLRALIFLLTVALVIGAILVVVNRDKLNFDALKRWFTYRSLAQSDTTGGGEPFAYQGGNALSLAVLDGDLLAVSENGVRLYSPGGTAYIEDTVILSNPTCQVGGKYAVAYDAGGSFLRVYHDREQVFDLNTPNATILSARLNSSGYLTVITRSSGYKGLVSVYDPSFQLRLELSLSSVFALDGVVTPDNRSVAVITAGQQDQFFSASLALYSLTNIDEDNPVPDATLALGSQLPLDLLWDSSGLRLVAEHAVISADSSLSQTGSADWSDRYLKRFSLLGDEGYVILTSKYRAGSQTKLEVLSRSGEVTAQMDEIRPILSLSAAGRYVAVLTAGELTIYTRDLTPYSTVENTQGASQVVLLPDGSAYLATGDTAWLYLPD